MNKIMDIMDLHTHTLASGHAYNTIEEMAGAAADNGLKVLGITEHAPEMPGTCHLFYFQNLKVLPRQMYGVKMLFGAELNITDHNGALDLPEECLKKLDICIASIHPPCLENKGIEANTNAVIGAMKNPYVNIIGHPDDGRYELDYERIVRAAKEYNVLLEINNSSLTPGSFRMNAEENVLTYLKLCKEYGVYVIMDSDAHCKYDVGNHSYAEQILAKADFPMELVVNDSIEKLNRFLKK